jgi:hypothetical protein
MHVKSNFLGLWGGNEYSLHISLVQRDLSRTEIIMSNS